MLVVVNDVVLIRRFAVADLAVCDPAFPVAGGTLPPPTPLPFPAYLGASGVLAAAFTWIAFTRHHWILKASLFVSVLAWLVFSFAAIYWVEGNVCDSNFAFGQYELSKNQAPYFTVGTFTTAGTGNLSARSRTVRATVMLQMTADVLVLVIGIAGLVR